MNPIAATVPREKQLELPPPKERHTGIRLTEEWLQKLRVAEGLLTEVEEQYFRERLKEADKAFAFTDAEMVN